MKLILVFILFLLNLLYIPLNRQVAKFSFKTRFDGLIPLLPWTVWIYVGYYLLFPFSIIALWSTPWIIPLLATQVLATSLATLIWRLFPNGVVRPSLENHLNHRGYRLLNLIYQHDRDCNGLPSGHVLHSFIACFYLAQQFPGVWPLFFGILFAISFSTLTTRQHYFLDMVTTLAFTPLLIELAQHLL